MAWYIQLTNEDDSRRQDVSDPFEDELDVYSSLLEDYTEMTLLGEKDDGALHYKVYDKLVDSHVYVVIFEEE